MTAAQTRIAETLEVFYGSADRASEGAMAGHAYKRSVDDLDGGIGRELVSTWLDTLLYAMNVWFIGCPLSDYNFGTTGQDVCLFPCGERTHLETEQKSASRLEGVSSGSDCFTLATGLRRRAQQDAQVD
jgi:hypothetical protein